MLVQFYMAERSTAIAIPWNVAEHSDPDVRRGYFVTILRTIQSGCLSLAADVVVFQGLLQAHYRLGGPPKSLESSGQLTDPRSILFLEALFYHVAVFQLTLKDIRGFIESGDILPGMYEKFDLEATWSRTRQFVKQYAQCVESLRKIMEVRETPFAEDSFVGTLVPTAAPRELLLSMVWTQKFRELNYTVLKQRQSMTEADLRQTLG